MKSEVRYPLLSELAGSLEGWAVAFFGDHLAAQSALASVADDRRHLWLLVWSQLTHRAERVVEPTDLIAWRARLQRSSFKSIVRQAGFEGSRGLQRCFQRIGWRALISDKAYLMIADVLAGTSAAAKVLHHAKCIDQRTVHLLPVFANSDCPPNLARALINDRRIKADHARRILWRLEQVRRSSPDLADRLVERFCAGKSAFDEEAWADATFPEPPWQGTARLRPITSKCELDATAIAFKNCLSHYLRQICSGERYFYRFEDIAVVEVQPIAGIGWEVECYLGKRNALISDKERRMLEAELALAPQSFCKVLPNKPMWEA